MTLMLRDHKYRGMKCGHMDSVTSKYVVQCLRASGNIQTRMSGADQLGCSVLQSFVSQQLDSRLGWLQTTSSWRSFIFGTFLVGLFLFRINVCCNDPCQLYLFSLNFVSTSDSGRRKMISESLEHRIRSQTQIFLSTAYLSPSSAISYLVQSDF